MSEPVLKRCLKLASFLCFAALKAVTNSVGEGPIMLSRFVMLEAICFTLP